MTSYESASRIKQLQRDIPILESQLAAMQNRRRELQEMHAKNEPLRKKLLARNRIDINRAIDALNLLKTELWGLQEQNLPRM